MIKIIMGVLSIIFGILGTWSTITDKNVALYLYIPLCLATGIFLILYDNANKKSFASGFKTRKILR